MPESVALGHGEVPADGSLDEFAVEVDTTGLYADFAQQFEELASPAADVEHGR